MDLDKHMSDQHKQGIMGRMDYPESRSTVSVPTSPKLGTQMLNRATNILREWNGSEWVQIKRRWEIDPETWRLTGVEGGPFNAQEFAAIERPTCPVCGDTVDVDRIGVTGLGNLFPQFIAGGWDCPQDCDPRPRKR